MPDRTLREPHAVARGQAEGASRSAPALNSGSSAPQTQARSAARSPKASPRPPSQMLVVLVARQAPRSFPWRRLRAVAAPPETLPTCANGLACMPVPLDCCTCRLWWQAQSPYPQFTILLPRPNALVSLYPACRVPMKRDDRGGATLGGACYRARTGLHMVGQTTLRVCRNAYLPGDGRVSKKSGAWSPQASPQEALGAINAPTLAHELRLVSSSSHCRLRLHQRLHLGAIVGGYGDRGVAVSAVQYMQALDTHARLLELLRQSGQRTRLVLQPQDQ